MSSITTLRTALRASRALRPNLNNCRLSAATSRPIHQSAAARTPYKDDQDRESLSPKAHDSTMSATDDEVATKHDASFNKDKTDPQTSKDASAAASNGNPLDFSPADQGFSQGGSSGHEEDAPHDTKVQGGQKKASGGGGRGKKGKKA